MEILENGIKMIDKAPILAIPPKAFGDKHFAAEFNKFRMFLLSLADEVNKRALGYTGSLRLSDAMPTQPGLYKLLEFGTYTNLTPAVDDAGNPSAITAIDTKINEAYYDGVKWVNSKLSLPQATQYIAPFEGSNFPIMGAAQRVYENSIWELSENQTAQSTDIPGVSNKWRPLTPEKKLQSDNLFDPETIVLDYYINSDGNIESASGWFYSQKIKVTPGKTLNNRYSLAGAFYDSNNAFIIRIPASQEKIMIPSNASYYVATGVVDNNLNSKMLTIGKEDSFSFLAKQSGRKSIDKSILPPSVLSRKGNNLIVSVKGGGDFRWINDALDWLKNSGENDKFNPFTFEIIDGVYNESVDMCGLYLSLIGRNRENCIIKNYLNDYYKPPIDMAGNNHLSNLTIISDDDGQTTPPNGVNGLPSYGIHFDISSRYESMGEKVQGRSFVDNCRVMSIHTHAVGQGLWTNTHSIWSNSEFWSKNKNAFRSHSYMPAGATNQRFSMYNCRAYNDNALPVMVIQDPNLADGNDNFDTVYAFQNNVFWNSNGQTGNSLLETPHDPIDGGDLSGRIKLGKESFGNNIPRLNK